MKKTAWINAVKHPPIREGVYETKLRNDGATGPYFNYWDGKEWSSSQSTVDKAIKYKKSTSVFNGNTDFKYRGMVKQ